MRIDIDPERSENGKHTTDDVVIQVINKDHQSDIFYNVAWWSISDDCLHLKDRKGLVRIPLSNIRYFVQEEDNTPDTEAA